MFVFCVKNLDMANACVSKGFMMLVVESVECWPKVQATAFCTVSASVVDLCPYLMSRQQTTHNCSQHFCNTTASRVCLRNVAHTSWSPTSALHPCPHPYATGAAALAGALAAGDGSSECWSSLHTILASRSASTEEMACLLASLLLGFGLDAFVVVGRLKNGARTHLPCAQLRICVKKLWRDLAQFQLVAYLAACLFLVRAQGGACHSSEPKIGSGPQR